MDFQAYTEKKAYFEHCLDILSNDTGFYRELLQITSYNEFLLKLQTYLQDKQTNYKPEYIHECLELALCFNPPLSVYKPKINLELDKIHGFTRLAILSLWLAGKIGLLVTQKPFGGNAHWLKYQFMRKPHSQRYLPPADFLVEDENPDTKHMKEKLNHLGDNLWRQHIDWEDQLYGPNVYDEGLHGGDIEPGYIDSALKAQKVATILLGKPLDITEYEQLFLSGRRHIQKSVGYDTTPRNLWRLKSLLESDVYDDIDPSHIRYIPHQRWEVLAFNYLFKKYNEDFLGANQHLVEYLHSKFGSFPAITKKLMNKEFMRCKICFFDEYHTASEIRSAIRGRLAGFYERMSMLGFDLKHGRSGPGNEGDGLLEIARLIRWLEILHPFKGGNTRHHIILLNKLLVEAGFSPAILSNRNDAPYRSDRGWMEQILTGMLRWSVVSGLIGTGLFTDLLRIKNGNQSIYDY